MTRGWIVAYALALAGCYAPKYRDCEIACTTAGCPDGLTCVANACRTSSTPGAPCGPIGGDGGSCTWAGVTPTNFDPCTLPAAISGASFANTVDTDPCIANGTVHGTSYTSDTVCLFHVDAVDIMGLSVMGSRPLLIVSDGDVSVSGQIIMEPSATDACGQPNSSSNAATSGGGGGGGGSTAGGNGGHGGMDTTFNDGTGPRGNAMLSPLLPGCAGGSGLGTPMHFPLGGMFGRGGGAIEIASATRVHVTGGIAAGGEQGFGGNGTSMSPAEAAGGGGGGAGGMILLEAPTIDIAGGFTVCAGGGGGGQGGSVDEIGGGGGAGGCSMAIGGNGISMGANGGTGSATAGAVGTAGLNGNTTTIGGGGGGGGAGWIRFHANAGMVTYDPALVAPAPIVD